jgi:hypothetical protein
LGSCNLEGDLTPSHLPQKKYIRLLGEVAVKSQLYKFCFLSCCEGWDARAFFPWLLSPGLV